MSAEQTTTHTHIMRAGLLVEESRAWWKNRTLTDQPDPAGNAFESYWFGMRSEARVQVLVRVLKSRFDQDPQALAVLRQWADPAPEERALVCHWHIQISDPLYRAFSGALLPARRARGHIRQSQVVDWLEAGYPDRWATSSRLRLSSAMLSCAHHTGLLSTTKDPRPLQLPRISDRALGYILHLLRQTDHTGGILDNPYLSSVGLIGEILVGRLRRLPGLTYRRMGHLVELDWQHDDLTSWAKATL